MTDQTLMQNTLSEGQEIQFAVINETMLPELIQGQIGKLNELDAGVKSALAAAEQAEERAKAARNLSAGWSLFGDKKKEAIEGLQQAGIELAGAVQSGAKTQKLSFEFQQRLAEVTKYLFGLGVGNIAANRAVVRELELRLAGASEEQLSELAREEVTTVVRQLKEQEDLLRKQEQMKGVLKEHDQKIRHLLGQTDELGGRIQDQAVQQSALVSRTEAMSQASGTQQKSIATLQDRVVSHQDRLDALAAGLAEANSQSEQSSRSLLARLEELGSRLRNQDGQHHALANLTESVVQASKQQQHAILNLQAQVAAQQAGLEKLVTSLAQSRSAMNVRTALLVALVTTLPAAAYFLR